jgi:hypothetical protein
MRFATNLKLVASMQADSNTPDTRPCVFLSHSSQDAALVDEVCQALESQGLRCWLASRDAVPGRPYAGELVRGIEQSAAFVLLATADAVVSPHVLNEVDQAQKHKKPIYPVFFGTPKVPGDLDYYISRLHWLQQGQSGAEGLAVKLLRVIEGRQEWQELAAAPSIRRKLRFKGESFLAAAAGSAVVLAIALAVVFYGARTLVPGSYHIGKMLATQAPEKLDSDTLRGYVQGAVIQHDIEALKALAKNPLHLSTFAGNNGLLLGDFVVDLYAKNPDKDWAAMIQALKPFGWKLGHRCRFGIGTIFDMSGLNDQSPPGAKNLIKRYDHLHQGDKFSDPRATQIDFLMAATWRNDAKLVQALIDAGADPGQTYDVPSSDLPENRVAMAHFTAASEAELLGLKDVAAVLSKAGRRSK